MLEYNQLNDDLITIHARVYRETTKKYVSMMHRHNTLNYAVVGGIKKSMWHYATYFNVIESYINRGRVIKAVGDIGCGAGIGHLVYSKFYTHLDIDFYSLKRWTPTTNKYDHILNDLGYPFHLYSGDFDNVEEDPIFFSPEIPKLDAGIAHRVVADQPNYNWENFRPFFNDQGFILTTYDQTGKFFEFDITQHTFK